MRDLSPALAALAVLGLFQPAAALAQEAGGPPPASCTVVRVKISGLPGACARALINRQLMIHQSDVLQHIVGGSFDMGPDEVAPAGLGDLTADEAKARLADQGALHIEPTADVTAAPAGPNWNIWRDAKYTWNDSSPANFDLDGGLFNGLAGLDYKINSKLTLGVMTSYESSHLYGTGVEATSYGFGAGPYLGWVLTDHWVFSASVMASDLHEWQSGPLHFDSLRVQGASALTGYYYIGTWRITPSLSASWSKEWQNETTGGAPDQSIESALLSPSLQLGDTLRVSDRVTAEPWVGTALDWNFYNHIDPSTGASIDNPGLDLRLQAGLNLNLGTRVQVSLTGETSGLLDKTFDSYSGEANLAVQF